MALPGLGFFFALGVKGLGGVLSIRLRTSSSLGALDMQKVTLIESLPIELYKGIGRVIYAHAILEHHLQACIKNLTGMGHKEARIALGEPRSENKLQAIKSLIKVHGLEVAIPVKLTAAPQEGTRGQKPVRPRRMDKIIPWIRSNSDRWGVAGRYRARKPKD
ncbi:hypothetical protein AYO42_03790 [Rhizomicrobium sp. SCGC AG-212-E05]|nr:hypothetical protein AYO42_03790 [Rhizomicrobium sp. SCGC AG-212-E05]